METFKYLFASEFIKNIYADVTTIYRNTFKNMNGLSSSSLLSLSPRGSMMKVIETTAIEINIEKAQVNYI